MSTVITYKDGNIQTEEKKSINVNRGKVEFSNELGDFNHTIYNNLENLDGEGQWDGMKINAFRGLEVRIGNASGERPTRAMQVNEHGVRATNFIGVLTLQNIDLPANAENAGKMRYREVGPNSYVEVCMKDGDKFVWEIIGSR